MGKLGSWPPCQPHRRRRPARPASRLDENTNITGYAVPSIRLGAGQRAAVTSRGMVPNEGPSMDSVAAWTQRRLVFHNESSSAVVGEFNRFCAQPLVVEDLQPMASRISGAFDLNDPEALLASRKTFETVRIERSFDGSEHLSRGPAE